MLHAHMSRESIAKDVADCYYRLKRTGTTGKYSLNIKNKACRLAGLYIKMVN
jgi:hypothetical protein